MNVPEKILEEIEEKFKTADAEKCDCEELCDVEDWYDSGYIDGQLSAHEKCMDIIRSHMDEAKGTNVHSNDDTEEKIREHIAECLHRIDNIRSFIGSKEYTSNDEKCIRNIEVLKTSITALEEYLSSKKKNGKNGWIDRKNLKEEIKSLRFTITGMRNGKTMTKLALEEYRKIILKIIDEQPTYMDDGWIPVKRLPEHNYETVLCVDASDYYFVAVYTKKDGFRTEDFGADYENIIAWQPLPKPYRPKEKNNE